MTALRELSLKQNQMSGALCPEWSRMSALQVLELDGNRLKGTLPPAWSALNDLQDLDIAFNRMSGMRDPTYPPPIPVCPVSVVPCLIEHVLCCLFSKCTTYIFCFGALDEC
jgi:hypothetical protein